jgi:hypothetical protein
MAFLRNPPPPRLPDPEVDYSSRWQNALLQVLRLYFSQVDDVLQALMGRNGGRFLEVPTASFYADVDQALTAGVVAAVAVPMLLNVQGFTLASPSKIKPDYAGTYSVVATLSVRNTGASQVFKVWLRKNAVDRQTSCIELTLLAGATASVMVSYLGDLLPTDTCEIMVLAAAAGVSLHAPVAAAPAPRGAASRIDVVFVSNDSTAGVTSALFRVKKTITDPPP